MYNIYVERIDELNIDDMKLIQNTDYFLFGMDSVLVANNVKPKKNALVVDLCTGSFVIPLIIYAKHKDVFKIVGVELQDEMYQLAIRNIELNNVQDKCVCIKQDVKKDKEILKWIKEHTNRDMVDVVVCNPPYKEKKTGVLNEGRVKYNARHEELCSLEDIFKTSGHILKTRGKLYLVHKPERIVDVLTLARKYNLEAKTIRCLHKTQDNDASLLFVEYVKNGGRECKVFAPLVQYVKYGEYSKEIKSIYE